MTDDNGEKHTVTLTIRHNIKPVLAAFILSNMLFPPRLLESENEKPHPPRLKLRRKAESFLVYFAASVLSRLASNSSSGVLSNKEKRVKREWQTVFEELNGYERLLETKSFKSISSSKWLHLRTGKRGFTIWQIWQNTNLFVDLAYRSNPDLVSKGVCTANHRKVRWIASNQRDHYGDWVIGTDRKLAAVLEGASSSAHYVWALFHLSNQRYFNSVPEVWAWLIQNLEQLTSSSISMGQFLNRYSMELNGRDSHFGKVLTDTVEPGALEVARLPEQTLSKFEIKSLRKYSSTKLRLLTGNNRSPSPHQFR